MSVQDAKDKCDEILERLSEIKREDDEILVGVRSTIEKEREVLDLLLSLKYLVLDVSDSQLHFGPSLLRLKGLPHAVSDGTFIQCLVGLDSHLDLVTHPDQ